MQGNGHGPDTAAVTLDSISVLAHEIRGPVGVVTGYLENIRDMLARGDADPNVVRRSVETALGQARDLNELCRDLIDAARAEGATLPEDAVVLDDEIDAVVAALPAEKAARIRIHRLMHPVVIPGHRVFLRRVISNLVDNALKYSPSGGEVDLRIAVTRRYATLSVADTGVGMDPDEIPKMFQLFARIDDGSRPEIPGSGVGLYFCAAVVDGHGGEISVDSERGEGTTVTVTLPRIAATH